LTASIGKRHTRIVEQLDRALELAGDPARLERHHPGISEWSVGQQLEHLTNVLRGVVDTLDKLMRGEAEDPAPPNPMGRLFLLLGWIPRGRGKAPERMRPKGIDAGELAAYLAREKRRLGELDLEALDGAAGTLPHPVFGPLTARRWLRFLEVHNHHHWRIVRDILQSSR